ncbi:hypothetical protein VL15_14885 [Burkholderia cepacia]|uniref:Uncharacterized protein n=2 Tax=Burkholderia cepacia TaxID=292 RepID=A0A0J5WQP1_BURCE|nr:hypothetical protein VL15_14885 [Burkholderia cepacia]
MQCMCNNKMRVQNGKCPIPLIVRDDATQDQFRILKQQIEKQYRDSGIGTLTRIEQMKYREKLSDQEIDRRYSEPMSHARELIRNADILQNMEVRSNTGGFELSRMNWQRDKLYIAGHCAAGTDILSADTEGAHGQISVADLAEQLATGGLDRDFRDFRVKACFSADAREPASFRRDDLQRAAAPKVDTLRRFLGLFGGRMVSSQPFAQSLCNALSERGFGQPEVSGYHGEGVTGSRAGHHMRSLSRSGLPGVRASEVKRMFTPSKN